MTLRPDLIQSALIAYLKTKTAVTSLLSNGATDIKESQWQGRDFDYPAVRLMLSPIDPYNPDCNRWECLFTWVVFSEEASSAQANKISGIIHNVLHGKSFSHEETDSGQTINFSLWTNSIVPAQRRDERTWRSEVLMRGTVSG